jgi:dihydrofolate reductase
LLDRQTNQLVMRKLIVEEWMSLDGYVADKENQLIFFARLVRESYKEPARSQFLQTIDSILLGRETYEQFVKLWPDRETGKEVLADKMNGGQKIVFSSTLTSAPWGKWAGAEIANGDAVSAIRKLKSTSGQNMILWGSISLAQALMKENLVDELHLHICPTLTAGGRRFFTSEINLSALRLSEFRQYGEGAVFLNYQLLK